MRSRLKILIFMVPFLVFLLAGCQKGTFDINSPNPNVPSTVSPGYLLSAALAGSAVVQLGNGYTDVLNTYMGYLALSADYIPNSAWLTYNVTSDFGSGTWDVSYPLLQNYLFIANTAATDSTQYNFLAIAKIMMAFHFSRLVDIYNDIPYTQALQGATAGLLFPAYDPAATVYSTLIHQLDTAIIIINNNPGANSPGEQDIMFGGNMTEWIQFANSVKLRMLMNLSQTAGGPATIQAELSGLTPSSFLGVGEDAVVQPGYTNSAYVQQSPLWQDFGFSPSGSANGNENYFVACNYIVNFWSNTNDTYRPQQIFCLNNAGNVQGRPFGSTNGSDISPGVVSLLGYPANPSPGPYTSGLVTSPTMGAVVFSASESLFLQAEAALDGYLSGGNTSQLYNDAVQENFRLISVPNYVVAAAAYTGQAAVQNANLAISANPLQTIILQKWASLIVYDPLESWCDWRRLGIPSDLPVSIFPGNTATHIPYRLLYPTSEYKYNTVNVNKEGAINVLTDKIFWMP